MARFIVASADLSAKREHTTNVRNNLLICINILLTPKKPTAEICLCCGLFFLSTPNGQAQAFSLL